MAHEQQLRFVETVSKHVAPNGFAGKKILEIGSYDVNGSIRKFFGGSRYVGVDLSQGPGVDVVCEGDKVADPDSTYDLTVSCECFEHNPKWLETFLNMYRMTKPGGIVMFTCATTGRLEHGTTRMEPLLSPGTQSIGWDYYLNLRESDFRRRLDFDSLFKSHFFLTNRKAKDLYFVGLKKGEPGVFRLDCSPLRAECLEAAARPSTIPAAARPKSMTLLLDASLLPVKVLALLPEKLYQNSAYYYLRAHTSLRLRARALLRPFFRSSWPRA